MKLEDLHDMIDRDLIVDRSDLGKESLDNVKLYTKYIRLWSEEKMKKESMLLQIEREIKDKRDYYMGNASAEVYKAKPFNLKLKHESSANKYINADDDIIKLKQKILIQEQKVDVIESALDQIKSRGFAIKNAIEYFKFLEGH